jgi:hypothetical protein
LSYSVITIFMTVCGDEGAEGYLLLFDFDCAGGDRPAFLAGIGQVAQVRITWNSQWRRWGHAPNPTTNTPGNSFVRDMPHACRLSEDDGNGKIGKICGKAASPDDSFLCPGICGGHGNSWFVKTVEAPNDRRFVALQSC